VSPSDAGGSTSDLLGIVVKQESTAIASVEKVALTGGPVASATNPPVRLGRFILSFLAPIATDQVVTLAGGPGDNLSYFTSASDSNSFVTAPTNATSSITIPAAAVPEPASLGVLALGGLALLSRRRKSA